MNTHNKLHQEFRSDYQIALAHDRFGLSVAARLSDASDTLPNDLSERLRVARAQAVAKRKMAPTLSTAPRTASVVLANGSSATLGSGGSGSDDDFSLWGRFMAALPLIALVVGLVSIHFIQSERRVNEIAEIDTALLMDDLPPSAYTDPGFVQFLKAKRDMQQ